MAPEAMEEEYTPDEEDTWQISCLVSADSFDGSPDTGRIVTGRMKTT